MSMRMTEVSGGTTPVIGETRRQARMMANIIRQSWNERGRGDRHRWWQIQSGSHGLKVEAVTESKGTRRQAQMTANPVRQSWAES
eukprot:172290-Pelagomonas_calceolata.AAC.1